MASETTSETDDIHEWLMRYIKRQRFEDSLEWIRQQIKADGDDGFPYTKDAAKMTALRDVFKRQMEFVRQEQ